MLTEEQVIRFQTFGFLIFRQLFSPDELRTIDAEFTHALESAYHHAPFDGTRRHWVPMMGPETPFFASLLEDPRFCEATEQLYGDDAIGIIVDANRYVGNTGWHPDTGSLHQFGVKFAFYLEPVGAETGALRVIPGSHHQPFHDILKQNMSQTKLEVRDVPACVCESEPGDVVAFDLRVWHASYGGSNDRRMCTLVYYHNPETPEQEEVTRKQAENNIKTPAHFNRPNDPIYDSHWVANPQRNPKRQRWINRMQELGFLESVQT
ncbi:MAG: phytanoyl-CoA dioxygenase family protein [Candidatus Latescibacteria bacterium]|nr:phytanoyl-CoA dioxygenase family protein [Candidatus Latescibacterota bacterium]